MAGEYPFIADFFDLTNGTAVVGSNSYKTDLTHTGSVTVIYYNTYIIAGTFAFDGVNDSGIVVHVTDGRFDVAR